MVTHRILFVCLGNICRSPMAEGVFRRVVEAEGLTDRFEIDLRVLAIGISGRPPIIVPRPPRSCAASTFPVNARGRWCSRISRGSICCWSWTASNYAELKRRAPAEGRGKIRHFLDFAPQAGTKDVPDPFFGGAEGFDHALDLIEQAANGLLASLVGEEAVPAKRGA